VIPRHAGEEAVRKEVAEDRLELFQILDGVLPLP
jgi:hypothetical protein